jgi:hypothetical protein
MNPPTGTYKQILTTLPNVKLAFTHTPIIGMRVISSDVVLEVLDNSDHEWAKYYADNIRNGNIVPIVPQYDNKIYKPGELYFTT